jgi:hypothetical protein
MDLLSDYQDEGDTFDPSALVQSDANENDQDEQGMCVLRGIMTFMGMTFGFRFSIFIFNVNNW